MTDTETSELSIHQVLQSRIVGMLPAPGDDTETLAGKIMAWERFKEWSKSLAKDAEECFRQHLEEHGSVQVGDQLYWSGVEKTPPKCTNLPAAFDSLFRACGGDFEAITRHLSAGALKYGACKETLGPDLYGKFLVVEEKPVLLSDEAGKARKKLQKTNPQFVR